MDPYEEEDETLIGATNMSTKFAVCAQDPEDAKMTQTYTSVCMALCEGMVPYKYDKLSPNMRNQWRVGYVSSPSPPA